MIEPSSVALSLCLSAMFPGEVMIRRSSDKVVLLAGTSVTSILPAKIGLREAEHLRRHLSRIIREIKEIQNSKESSE